MEQPRLVLKYENERSRERAWSIAKRAGKIGLVGLEAAAGGVAGWHIADNFVNPTYIDTNQPDMDSFRAYAEQILSNTIGFGVGAVTLPIALNARKIGRGLRRLIYRS